jgi:hypothetical protein
VDQADFDADYVFSHHPPTAEQIAHFAAIHAGARQFALVILEHAPASSDRAAAVRLLREASMMACAAVALEGRLK